MKGENANGTIQITTDYYLQMKKTAALLLAAVLTGASLSAEETSAYSITLDFPYVTDYVFRGVKYADDSIQPSIEFASGDFYAGVWTSMPIGNRKSGGYTNEFDFYAGYGIKLNDTWSLDVGATYYFYPETPSGDEQFEPFIGATGDLGGGFSASAYYYYETEFEISTFQGELGYSIELAPKNTLDFSADYGFVTGGGDSYSYYSLSSTLNHAFTDTAGGYIGVVYADNTIGGGVEDSFVYLITGVSIGF